MSGLDDLKAEQAKARQLGKYVKAWDPAVLGVRAPNPRTVITQEIVADLDIEIPLRDGITLRGNIHRPSPNLGFGSKFPVVLNYSLYGKDGGTDISIFPLGAGLDRARISSQYVFEAADPAWWCRHGYIVASVDARGSYMSEGDKAYYSRDVGLDGYDIVEWLGAREWSNGKVALYGASGYAMVQWLVAPEKPPHLAAIIPIDGMTDIYREMARKGGVLETQFNEVYPMFYCWGKGEVEDCLDGPRNHPYFDDYWKSKIPKIEEIDCPTYIICSWGDNGIHTRGTLHAYKTIPAEHKYLEIHQEQKWEWAATEESLLRQKAFLDTYLLDRETEVKFWPKVRWAMRESYYVGEWRTSSDFPFPDTQYKQFYPTLSRGLSEIPQSEKFSIEYDAKSGEAELELPFTASFEFAGHAKLKLWVELKGAENADLHITLRKTDKTGKEVHFPWLTVVDTGPIAFGWLKVSRRELDEEKSTRFQPYHKHARDIPVKQGEIVPVEIEIQPTSCRFRPGDRLRLVISGHDYGTYPQGAPIARHKNDENVGTHVLHFGGEFDTHLQLPAIPPVTSSLQEESPMVKMSMLACRVPGWSDEKFCHEYTKVHAAMTKAVSEAVPILRGYTQAVSVPQLKMPVALPFKDKSDAGMSWDCNTTLTWTTLNGLWGSFQAPEYKASAGTHTFVDETNTVGILCSAYDEAMFDPIVFKARDTKCSVIAIVFLAKSPSYDVERVSGDLRKRVDKVKTIAASTTLLRYVINKAITPADTKSFFRGTPFTTTDWHRIGAMEQWYFADEEAASQFFGTHQISEGISKLPTSFDATKSLMTIGKEHVVVAKDFIQ